jgi:hypothetical protein
MAAFVDPPWHHRPNSLANRATSRERRVVGVAEQVEVRRSSDGELLGYVGRTASGWAALAVFGGTIGLRPTADEARTLVENEGLAVLARRWFHRPRATGDWRIVVITEAWPGHARGVVGLYSLPGAERLAITADDLAAGDEMTLEPPDDQDLDAFLGRGR